MGHILNIIFFFFWFAIFLVSTIKFSTSWVSGLFTYHNYEGYRQIKNISSFKMFMLRFWKVFAIYIYLGTSLGLVVYVFGINYPPLSLISDSDSWIIALAPFIISFSSIMIFRFVILLDKTKICKKIGLEFVEKINRRFPYDKQKSYIESFLFSIIFLSVFSSLMYLGIQIITTQNKNIIKTISLVLPSFFQLSFFIFIFLIILTILTFISEIILYTVGVHYEKSYEENLL
ncbi:MAG: hypothetical protein KJ559_01430 [Nanoarchaeota archaeon]|nr:hypothetical protein [Nanoarchaeota archaeon]